MCRFTFSLISRGGGGFIGGVLMIRGCLICIIRVCKETSRGSLRACIWGRGLRSFVLVGIRLWRIRDFTLGCVLF